MISLNLLPDVKQEYLKTLRFRRRVISMAVLITIAAVSVAVLLASWVYIGQSALMGHYTRSIEEKSKEMRDIPDLDKYLTLQNQLQYIDALHAGKNDFSRLMAFLPKLNPKAPNNVLLASVDVVEGAEGSTMIFKGETKDYSALATFRDTLVNARIKYHGGDGSEVTEKLFESVAVTQSSIGKAQDGKQIVSFNIDAIYNPNAFRYSNKEVAVVVDEANTTPSVVGAPSVFGEGSIKSEEQ